MSRESIGRIVSRALSGGDGGPRWSVSGTNGRGTDFRIGGYRTRRDAMDYAQEVRDNGGSATVERVTEPGA